MIIADPISDGIPNQGRTTIITMDLYSNVRSYMNM